MTSNVKSVFFAFLYTKATKIRACQGLYSNYEEYPNVSTSRALLRLAVKVCEPAELETGLNCALKNLHEVPACEQSLLFEILDSSVTYMSKGDQVVLTEQAKQSLNQVYDHAPMEIVDATPGININCNLYSKTECNQITKIKGFSLKLVPLCEGEKPKISAQTLEVLCNNLCSPPL